MISSQSHRQNDFETYRAFTMKQLIQVALVVVASIILTGCRTGTDAIRDDLSASKLNTALPTKSDAVSVLNRYFRLNQNMGLNTVITEYISETGLVYSLPVGSNIHNELGLVGAAVYATVDESIRKATYHPRNPPVTIEDVLKDPEKKLTLADVGWQYSNHPYTFFRFDEVYHIETYCNNNGYMGVTLKNKDNKLVYAFSREGISLQHQNQVKAAFVALCPNLKP